MKPEDETITIEKTEEMEQYEKETGKKAIWRGTNTESYKKWLKGQKIYKRFNDTISIDQEFKDKIFKFCEEFNFIRAKTYRYGAELIIEACNKLKHTRKELDLETIKYYISNTIESNLDAKIIDDMEILKYYKTQMNSSINFCEEALDLFKNLYNKIKNNVNKDKLDSLINIYENIVSYLADSLEVQKEHTKTLESYLNVTSPIVLKSSKYQVLIIDDNKDVHKLVSSYFKEKGFNTESALNSFEALLLLKHSKPAVILLDIAIPDINGIDLCKRLRLNRNYNDVKIYFLTAHLDSFKGIKEFLDQKLADGIIKKPFGKADFEFLYHYLSVHK